MYTQKQLNATLKALLKLGYKTLSPRQQKIWDNEILPTVNPELHLTIKNPPERL